MKLGGVVYFHEISQTRMLGATKMHVDLFHKLCGEQALPGVVLMTTKWSHIVEVVGVRREKVNLVDGLWKDMVAAGSTVRQFEDTQESACDIINVILDKVRNTFTRDFLEIQQELVDIGCSVPEMNAGQTLCTSLKMYLGLISGNKAGNWEADDLYAKDKREENQKNIRKQLENLKIKPSRRVDTS